jgi:hypothetical protein
MEISIDPLYSSHNKKNPIQQKITCILGDFVSTGTGVLMNQCQGLSGWSIPTAPVCGDSKTYINYKQLN